MQRAIDQIKHDKRVELFIVKSIDRFTRGGFLPHSTVQKHARLNKGNEVIFNALSVIDMFPDEDPYQRKVIKTIKIGNSLVALDS